MFFFFLISPRSFFVRIFFPPLSSRPPRVLLLVVKNKLLLVPLDLTYRGVFVRGTFDKNRRYLYNQNELDKTNYISL